MADNKIIYTDELQKAIVDDVTIKGRAFAAVMRHIQEASAIDPVHAAGGCYCRECKHWMEVDTIYDKDMVCINQGYMRVAKLPGDFCSKGERNDNEKKAD